MNRTFLTLKQNVGKFVGDSSSDMLAMIGNFINDRYEEVLKRTNLLDVNRSDYQFTTTSGTEDYTLPQDFNKEISVVDLTNKLPLSRVDIQKHTEYNYSQLDSTGVTTGYIILEKTVTAQPSAASAIAVVSSSASDTTQTVYIKGLDASGYEIYESVTLTGISPASTTNTFTRLINISKSAVAVGNVTLTSNSGAVTNAVLSPSMLEHRVKLMRLVNIPNGSYTIEINYLQKILPMSQDYDYPIIPCEEVLESGAMADAWRFKRQFAKAADYDIIFEKRLANMLFDYENQPNKVQLFNVRSPRNYFDGGNVDDCRRYGVF